MGWKTYKLIYRAVSPIHIGWHTLGYIKLTRYYITGRAMWGAITANFTRTFGSPGVVDYERFGRLFKKEILTSYFYPALDTDPPLLPEFADGGVMHGDYSENKFERCFIKSYGQTAVMPDTNTAENESLHESEFIAPVIYDEDIKLQRPVRFVGYVFIKDDARTKNGRTIGWDDKEIKLKNAVAEIFIGGDRKYGWGRLKLIASDSASDMFGFDITRFPEVTILANEPIPAHLGINNSLNLKGDIEPLVGREWGEVTDKDGKTHKGFGQMISKADICWMPGSILEKDETLKIQKYGILSK